MKRLCIVDMNFTWPPDGGAPVELHWIATRFASMHETILVVPSIDRWSKNFKHPWPLSKTNFFVRGRISPDFRPAYRIERLALGALSSNPATVAKAVSDRLEELAPDHVLVADGWYFKPRIVIALSRYRPVLRLFSHEMFCIKGHGLLFRNGKVCDVDYLSADGKNVATCVACALKFYSGYPSPRWIFEFAKSRAYTSAYQRECLEAFNTARLVHVGNRSIERRLSPFIRSPVRFVPNAIDIGRFRPSDHRPPERPFTLLLLGRTDIASKGFDFALRALDLCWKTRQDFQVLIATNRSIPQRPFFRSLSWIPYERVHEVYEQGDALLVPSTGPDVFPNVVLEAMASGLPVVGTTVGGIPDQIVDGMTGFLVSPGDVDGMANRILSLIDQRESSRRMGALARHRAEKSFSIEGVFSEHYSGLFP